MLNPTTESDPGGTGAAHERYMREALAQARLAAERGEVPVGAVLVLGDTVIGRGFNQPISTLDPTAHAEVVALRAGANTLGNYRVVGADMYVTVEPCLMCLGALVHARVRSVVFGTVEPKTGAIVSAVRGLELGGLNHRFEVVGGVCEEECRSLMQAFFRERRQAQT